MSTFIKAGFWEKLCKPCKGYKGWLNLDELITNVVTPLIPPTPELTYKVYTAFLTQIGTSAPTANVLENTIGNIVIERRVLGVFNFSLVGAFPAQNKIWFSAINADGDSFVGSWDYFEADSVELVVTNSVTGEYTDFTNFSIEIRVYN